MVKTGRLRLRTYERRPVRIATFGDLVVTTGNEISQLVGETAEYKLFVSYMNVWTKREGNWQLLARHVGLIAREQTRAAATVLMMMLVCRCPGVQLPPAA